MPMAPLPLKPPMLCLLVPFGKNNRTAIMLPSTEHVIDKTYEGHANEHDRGPIERLNLDRCSFGPEAPEEGVQRVEKT